MMMKHILSILILSLPLTILGQGTGLGDPGVVAGLGGGGGEGGPTYIIEEDFEGTGYELGGWAENGTGTIDEDDTASPGPLAGSQSLRITLSSQNGRSDITFSELSDAWAYMLFNPSSLPAGTSQIFYFWNGGQRLRARITSGGAIEILANGGSASTTVGTMSAGTTYHVWFNYVPGGGTDAVASVGFSTDGTRPTSGNNYAESTNGTDTDGAVEMRIGSVSSTTMTLLYDKVRVDDVTIGDNPS